LIWLHPQPVFLDVRYNLFENWHSDFLFWLAVLFSFLFAFRLWLFQLQMCKWVEILDCRVLGKVIYLDFLDFFSRNINFVAELDLHIE
jgi:hypothetical protein